MTLESTVAAQHDARAEQHATDLERAFERVARAGMDPEHVVTEVARFRVAAPSWALGTGGTRFGRFPAGGEPRTIEEKLEDVAALAQVTGATDAISLHVPWDEPADPEALTAFAAELGIGFGPMNSNTFQDNASVTGDDVSFKFGSLANRRASVRRRAIEHNQAVIDLGTRLGSSAITIWLADGTNHPGQADFRAQFDRVADGLAEIHGTLPAGWLLFTEHKPFEPAFYSSVNPDWGSSLLLAQRAGPHARCLVDLGHHLPGTNIEQIVSRLAMVDRLGGFHFNDSKYGDDDLTVGSINPFQLFLIVVELVGIGGGRLPDLEYMIDESHNVKDPLEELAQATDALQHGLALALCVDRPELAAAQDEDDAVRVTELLTAAYRSDVRPLVAEARARSGAALEPVLALRDSGYRRAATETRGRQARSTGL